MTNIIIGSDHGGFNLKQAVVEHLKNKPVKFEVKINEVKTAITEALENKKKALSIFSKHPAFN